MYPQTVVPSGDDLHTTLTNGMDVENSGVIFTGDYYTANKDNLAWSTGVNEELNPVYEYKGKRYVRVTPFQYDANSKYHDNSANNNNGTIGQSGFRWFKVEPIKWIIINPSDFVIKNVELGITTDLGLPNVPEGATLELYAADVLMSGIVPNQGLWPHEDNTMRQYLNVDFYNQAFSDIDKQQIQVSRIFNNTNNTNYNNIVNGLNQNTLPANLTGQNQTDQNIYLLSWYELSNADSPYVTTNPIFENNGGAASDSRKVGGTDYARAHNLILSGGFTYYWTRTAYSGTTVYRVSPTGGFTTGDATYAVSGTRPALTMLCFAL